MSRKKNYNVIDIGKFVASFLVVAIHTHPLQGVENTFVQRLFEVIASLAVPFFFICSSFFFFLNPDIRTYRQKIYKFVRYYVIWSIIYIPLTIYGIILDGSTVGKQILLLFRGYFLIGENYYSWSLWYLLALIYSFSLICFLISKNVSTKSIGACSVGVYLVSCVVDCLVTNRDSLSGIMRFGTRALGAIFVNGRLFTAPIYIFIGYMLSLLYSRLIVKQSFIRKIATILVVVFGLLRCFIANLWLDGWMKVAMSVCVFVVLLFTQLPDSIWFSRLRKLSVVVYFVHLYVYFIVQKISVRGQYGMAAFLWTVGISFVIGCIVVCCGKNNQLLKKIF